MYLRESTSYVERPSAFWASSVLLSIGPMHWAHFMVKNRVFLRCLDAFPSLPGIVPHRKKERRAPARPVGPLTSSEELSLNWRNEVTFGTILPTANTCPARRERAAQTNVSCYTESPAGHRGPSGQAMHDLQGNGLLILPLGTGARTTTPNVTHPPPTYRLGGTSEIQLR